MQDAKSMERIILRNQSFPHSYLIVDNKDGLHPNHLRNGQKVSSSEGIHLNTLDELRTTTHSFTTISKRVLGDSNKVLVKKHKTKGKQLNPKSIQAKLVNVMAEFSNNNRINFNARLIIQ